MSHSSKRSSLNPGRVDVVKIYFCKKKKGRHGRTCISSSHSLLVAPWYLATKRGPNHSRFPAWSGLEFIKILGLWNLGIKVQLDFKSSWIRTPVRGGSGVQIQVNSELQLWRQLDLFPNILSNCTGHLQAGFWSPKASWRDTGWQLPITGFGFLQPVGIRFSTMHRPTYIYNYDYNPNQKQRLWSANVLYI